MEKSKDTRRGFVCPFCSAPYRDVIPSDAAQVKCDYCGSVFSVSSYFEGAAPRCPNHPEVFATGLCNDCGDNFCVRCLYTYDLETRSEKATLYLCFECLRKRHLDQANQYIFAGIFALLISLLILAVSPFMGILSISLVSIMIVYGLHKRLTFPKTASLYEEKELLKQVEFE